MASSSTRKWIVLIRFVWVSIRIELISSILSNGLSIIFACNNSFSFQYSNLVAHCEQSYRAPRNAVLAMGNVKHENWLADRVLAKRGQFASILCIEIYFQLTLIAFDWLFSFGFRIYGGIPYAALYCGGPLCKIMETSAIHVWQSFVLLFRYLCRLESSNPNIDASFFLIAKQLARGILPFLCWPPYSTGFSVRAIGRHYYKRCVLSVPVRANAQCRSRWL